MSNRRYWTAEEELYLIKNYGKKTPTEIGKQFNRRAGAISCKITQLRKKGLIKERIAKIWNEVESEFITENYGLVSLDEMARQLGVEKTQLSSRIRFMKEQGYPIREQTKLKDKPVKEKVEEFDEEGFKPYKREPTEKELSEAKEVQEIYDKMLDEKVIAGVYKKDLKVKVGQTYQIENMKKRTRQDKYFIGEVIQETKDHIIIKDKSRTESFLKVDFLIGEYKIKEVI